MGFSLLHCRETFTSVLETIRCLSSHLSTGRDGQRAAGEPYNALPSSSALESAGDSFLWQWLLLPDEISVGLNPPFAQFDNFPVPSVADV